MPYHRFDWHDHIKDVEDEYCAARFAVNHLNASLTRQSGILKKQGVARAHLRTADANLEGTYLVRLFASFEAALRSYELNPRLTAGCRACPIQSEGRGVQTGRPQ
jgi:hypothetical protein